VFHDLLYFNGETIQRGNISNKRTNIKQATSKHATITIIEMIKHFTKQNIIRVNL